MENALELLKQTSFAINELSQDEWASFSAIWKPFNCKRKEQLTEVGSIEKYLYFVYEGVQRVYYIDDDGREATIVFTYAPSFGGVIDSFMLQQPAKYFYETLTPSKFLIATESEVNKVALQNAGIETLLKKGITMALSGVLERIMELQCFTSEQKFKQLLSRSPHILQLVPHKYLANYIGIDATNFSKLINQVRI
ncbi:MAG: Crp/Fnr family transcriptional regulator [Candidatus Methylacidiphilales bacterium]